MGNIAYPICAVFYGPVRLWLEKRLACCFSRKDYGSTIVRYAFDGEIDVFAA